MQENEERGTEMRDGAGERRTRGERKGRKCPLLPFPGPPHPARNMGLCLQGLEKLRNDESQDESKLGKRRGNLSSFAPLVHPSSPLSPPPFLNFCSQFSSFLSFFLLIAFNSI